MNVLPHSPDSPQTCKIYLWGSVCGWPLRPRNREKKKFTFWVLCVSRQKYWNPNRIYFTKESQNSATTHRESEEVNAGKRRNSPNPTIVFNLRMKVEHIQTSILCYSVILELATCILKLFSLIQCYSTYLLPFTGSLIVSNLFNRISLTITARDHNKT